MTTFRTQLTLPKSNHQIDYSSKLFLMGSCFSEHIHQQLQHYLFHSYSNPLGITYHPISIANNLNRISNNIPFKASDLFQHNDLYNSFDVHSQFSDLDSSPYLETVNQQIKIGNDQLKNTDLLILTFGTAWVYQRKDNQQIVANCHKKEADFFNKRLLTIHEIITAYQTLIPQLLSKNKNLQIIFTVSPVRHWRDGVTQNQTSKSTLYLAIQELVNQFTNCEYFPSYEIMMDDLRDYRFYTEDMLHPNKTAIHYIWEIFKNHIIKESTFTVMQQIHKLQLSAAHRPFQATTKNHLDFKTKQLHKLELLQQSHPAINFDIIKQAFLR